MVPSRQGNTANLVTLKDWSVSISTRSQYVLLPTMAVANKYIYIIYKTVLLFHIVSNVCYAHVVVLSSCQIILIQ